MRQLQLWLDHKTIGCGTRSFLEVKADGKMSCLLYIQTLSELQVHLQDIEAQLRTSNGRETPLTPADAGFVIDAIRNKLRLCARHGYQYDAGFVREALAAIREAFPALGDGREDPALDPFPETAPAPSQDPSTSKGGTAATPWGGRSTPELLAEAVGLGYEERPFPNGGVRKMRIVNFLKSRAPEGDAADYEGI